MRVLDSRVGGNENVNQTAMNTAQKSAGAQAQSDQKKKEKKKGGHLIVVVDIELI